VSRRAVMEETRAEDRTRLMGALSEGQVLDGVVKNITDYGAFVDLGGVDGLLHVTDIAWKRINHPSEALNIGQQVKVQVIRFNAETQRISLGMKQHVSEMSWTKKNVHPGKIVSTSQEVEVMVLDVDMSKRRISLGLKQCLANPWESFAEKYPSGTEIDGEVRNITEFGLFVGLPGDIDGMVHLSDLSWEKSGDEAIRDFKKGDNVKVKVLDVDVDKERISLGIKQLANDPFEKVGDDIKKGEVVTVIVAAIQDNGIDVTVKDGIPGFIRKSELSRDRSEQRPDRYAVGDKLDAKITNIDKASRRVVLSVKARELDEEKKAMADFGSSDSGASLGDILGAALNRANKKTDEEDDEK
jgi:small subunit ribosomal protein S1